MYSGWRDHAWLFWSACTGCDRPDETNLPLPGPSPGVGWGLSTFSRGAQRPHPVAGVRSHHNQVTQCLWFSSPCTHNQHLPRYLTFATFPIRMPHIHGLSWIKIVVYFVLLSSSSSGPNFGYYSWRYVAWSHYIGFFTSKFFSCNSQLCEWKDLTKLLHLCRKASSNTAFVETLRRKHVELKVGR